MAKSQAEQRKVVSGSAKAFLAGQISFSDFMKAVPANTEDKRILILADLIEHEPKKGGFLGASESEWKDYRSQIQEALEALESE